MTGSEKEPLSSLGVYFARTTRVSFLRIKKITASGVRTIVDGSGTELMLKVPVASGTVAKAVDELIEMLAFEAPGPGSSWFLKVNVSIPPGWPPSHAITAAFVQTLCPLKNVKTEREDGVVPQFVPVNCSPVFAAAVRS